MNKRIKQEIKEALILIGAGAITAVILDLIILF